MENVEVGVEVEVEVEVGVGVEVEVGVVMTIPLAFLDTETTGLDPDLHEIWEVGLILRAVAGYETKHHWFLPVDLGRADYVALKIGRYHERHPWGNNFQGGVEGQQHVSSVERFAREFSRLTNDTHLVGAVTSFDEERLRKLLRANGRCPGWHYHLVDVEGLAAGYLSARAWTPPRLLDTSTTIAALRNHFKTIASPPWESETLSRAVGVDPGDFDRHTALGDAEWARAIYDATIGKESQ